MFSIAGIFSSLEVEDTYYWRALCEAGKEFYSQNSRGGILSILILLIFPAFSDKILWIFLLSYKIVERNFWSAVVEYTHI